MSNPALGNDFSPAGFRRGLVVLALLGLIVRLGFVVEHARSPSWAVPTLDQAYYDSVARMLLAGEDLHELRGFRPLLYPLFLAVCRRAGGGWGLDLALLAQHGLGVATGLAVALLGARLFRHRLAGLLAGALFLLAPVPLYFEGEMLVESGYTFLICLALLATAGAAGAQGGRSAALWLVSGAGVALAAQARSNILVFLAVYPLFALWRGWQARTRAALLPLLGLLGCIAMALPWAWLNMRQSDRFHLLPSAAGASLYLGNKRTADGMVPLQERRITYTERYQDSVEVWAREEYERVQRAQGRAPDPDPMAVSRYWTGRTIEEIRAAPGRWLGLVAKKCWLTFWNVEVPNNKAFAFLRGEFLWLRLLPVRWVVLLALAPAGLWAAFKYGRRDDLLVLLVYAGLYSAANVAFFICDRYRYPVWPALAILAGGGCAALVQSVRLKNWGRLARIGAGMIVMAALSLPNWGAAQLPSYARDHLFRSLAAYQKGRFAEALIDIDRSLALDGSDPTAYQHRGNVLAALNRLPEARASFEQALRLSPDEAATWNNLGATLDAMGNTDDAIRAFRRATESSPPSKNAFLGLACALVRSGQLDAAAQTLDRAERAWPKPDAALLAARSAVERRRGNAPQAEALETWARALDPAAAEWALRKAAK